MRDLQDLKITKEQLTSLLDLVRRKLADPNMPASNEEKQNAQNFIKEFTQTLKESQLEFFPLSEIISLLILEQTGQQTTLKNNLKNHRKLTNYLKKFINQ